MLITEDLLLHYKRCPRRAFLDIYNDPNSKDRDQDFLLKLRQDSLAHRQSILALTTVQRPYYPSRDWQAGANATLELMQQGVEQITKGVLMLSLSDDLAVPSFNSLSYNHGNDLPLVTSGSPIAVTLVAYPDLLTKHPGKSDFGDWIYVPTTIKLGRRPKPEYQIVAALQAQLLAATQGVWSETAQLILRNQDSYSVKLERWVPQMQTVLKNCIETLLASPAPEVFISRHRCSLCHWYSDCYAQAQAQQHLSLLPGVTPSRYQDLQMLNLTTPESLANASPAQLETVFDGELTTQLIRQAQAVVQNRAILKTDSPTSGALTIPSAPVELYFDIEAEPERHLDYLLGVLVVEREAERERFYPFLAEQPFEEAAIWQQFLELVARYPDAPIFHYSDYEVDTVKRLAKLYDTPRSSVKSLLSRFVDVHQCVMGTVTFPVESYSLKHLAHWLGFEWRDAGASGAQCVWWYDQWLRTGDRTLLEAILRYNEDDCRATYRLKTWLCEFLQAAATNCN
jgi:predicted RecB family nuclease